MDMQNYSSGQDDAGSRRHGTFSYLPKMDDQRLKRLVDYIVTKGWAPAVEHVESEGAERNYWYMWKLPMFSEPTEAAIMRELNLCREAYPDHLVRLVAYDSLKQTQGTSVVVFNPGA